MSDPLWHHQSVKQVADQFQVDPATGLSSEQAAGRLLELGFNRLQEPPIPPWWLKLLGQFNNALVMVLLVAVVLAAAVGHVQDAVVILVVVLINALLGFYQEYRAEATLSALKQMLAQQARVRRDGQVMQIAAEQLVPGDVVLLEAGDRVPADARVVVAHNAELAEAVLTGEAHAVGKQVEALPPAEYPLAERINLVFMNTVVTRGRLEVLVVATGMATEMGRISGLLQQAQEHPTPLQIQLDSLGKRLAFIAVWVVLLIFVIGWWQGMSLIHNVMTAIALAVATIPEGLPAVVTVTLALGMHRMLQHKVIVKKLAAVETLGATTVICSDKTGTLTLNQMTVARLFYQGRRFVVEGEGYAPQGRVLAQDGVVVPDFLPLLQPGMLCSDSRMRDGELIGDPTEGALLVLAQKLGQDPEHWLEHCPRIAEIPFDSAHKFMATFHHDGEQVQMYVKGAPDVLLARASWLLDQGGQVQPLDQAARVGFEAENAHLAEQAMRVLVVARRTIPARDFDPAGDLMGWVQQLLILGLLGMIDPPRPEVAPAIRLCHRAGIQVKMITGDHAATACAIAHHLGIQGEVLTGAELDKLTPAQLAERIMRVAVFARVAPEHKVRIVLALKAKGQVVAMTGDGVNDAPALKNADIGVAMGRGGTEVTREAATMVLTDDNFASIVGAVQQGRTIYENIIKFVRFQLSTNVAAILTVLASQLLGLPTPFTAIQILWINIIMDGPPAISLGMETTRPGVMHEMPRLREARILTRSRLLRLLGFGTVMAAGTVGMFYYGLSVADQLYAQTLAFTTFVLFQFFNVFNARAEHGSAFNRQFFSNRHLWLALSGVLVLQLLVVFWQPAQRIFATTDLRWQDCLLAVAVAGSVLVLEELRKLLLRKK